MAGDWLKVEKATARKIEVIRIAGALGIHPDHAFGLCFRFWCWCDENLTSGNAPGVSAALLDALLERPGFADALVSVGWLRVREGSLEVPNFDRHLSQGSKTRALTAKRVAGHKTRGNGKGNAASVSSALPREREEKEKSNKHTLSRPREELPKETHLTDARFAAAWDRWGRHLLEHNKPLTTTAQESQLYKLADFSVDEAIAIVEFSILKDSKSLILNGDHRPREDDSRGVVTGRRRNLTSEDIRI